MDLPPNQEARSKENLAAQAPAESVALPSGFYQALVLDALTIISAIALGFFYRWYLDGRTTFTVALISATAFALLSVLHIFLTKNLWRRALVLALEGIALLFLFTNTDLRFLVFAYGAFILFSLWGEILGRKNLENGLDIQLFSTVQPAIGKFASALTFIALILYVPYINSGGVLISQQTFNKIFNVSANVVKQFYPEFPLTGTIGEFAKNIAQFNLRQNPQERPVSIDTQYGGAAAGSSEEKDIASASEEIISAIQKALGVPISKDDLASNVFYEFAASNLETLQGRFGQWFVVAWIFVIFFLIRSFTALFYWVVSLLSLLVFQLLLTVKVIRLRGENRTKEVIEFS